MFKISNLKAKREAEKLLEKYILSIPFSIEDLINHLGITLILCDPEELFKISKKNKETTEDLSRIDDILGFYDSENNKIYVNRKQNINRLRFTVAHEVGHSIIHKTNRFRKVFSMQDFFSNTPQEIQANYFAGYLLAPDKEIMDKLPLTEIMLNAEEIINNFSKMFGISPEAMRIRLKTFKTEHLSMWEEYKLSAKLF